MKCNLAVWDRALRFLFGTLFVAYAIAGGPFWAWGGLYLIATSGWGICPLYASLKIRTLPDRRRGGPR